MVCVMLTDIVSFAGSDKQRKTWQNILFSDESYFSVISDNTRIFIWRESVIRNNFAVVKKMADLLVGV